MLQYNYVYIYYIELQITKNELKVYPKKLVASFVWDATAQKFQMLLSHHYFMYLQYLYHKKMVTYHVL